MSDRPKIKNYHQLRKEFPYFIFEDYSLSIDNNNVHITFNFNLSDKYYFTPEINIPVKPFFILKNIKPNYLNNFIFNIGMVELISYWKAACPPKVIIRPHFLCKDQIDWWKKLYYNGLGEFFFVNGIDERIENFMDIIADKGNLIESVSLDLSDKFIIPVGGGKDSAVTMELLSAIGRSNPMVVNPIQASWSIIRNSGYLPEEVIEIKRKLDPKLLELNDKGFLNGHTPFSALLAFISALATAITGNKSIVLSNESSANEATIPGTKINHQYSKTFEFESNFRYYIKKYVCPDINYFSFLRPINELQIAKLLSGIPKHHYHFRSCNKGSKTNSWCGECSKCLFTYIILLPYLEKRKLIKIFGNNLLDNANLLNTFNELIGVGQNKPFECIGTLDEVNTALTMYLHQESDKDLPYLLKYYRDLPIFKGYKDRDTGLLESQFDDNNYAPEYLQDILKKALCLEK